MQIARSNARPLGNRFCRQAHRVLSRSPTMATAPNVAIQRDPEVICTRVVARLIEELSCVEIAPDSPAWTDLKLGEQAVGQLAVYRGRNGVDRVVASRIRLENPAMDSHMVAVFTDPRSLVPHLVVDAVVFGERGSFHADLLPRLDLGTSMAYVDRCYAPLDAVRDAADADERFAPGTAPRRQRALMSPWMGLYTLDPQHMDAAFEYVDRYVDHWCQLMRSSLPQPVQVEAKGIDLAARSARQRELIFSREVDPVWGMLDRVLGAEMVDTLLNPLAR